MQRLSYYLRVLNIKTDKINKIDKNDKIIFILRTDLIGDYIIGRDFIRAIRESEKFKSYKIVFLGNIVYRDISLTFDSKYVDEFIWLDVKVYDDKLYRYLLKQKINSYNYKYAFSNIAVRNFLTEDILKDVNAEEKYGIQGVCGNITEVEKAHYDTFYTKFYDITESYELADVLTGERVKRLGAYFELSEEKVKNKKYKLKQPFAILFPSASQEIKRLGFDKYLEFAKYLYEKYKIVSYISGSKRDRKIFKNYDIDVPYIKDICGKYKLSELPYIYKNAKIILTNDTCAMHIGKCVNDNVLVFSNVRIAAKEYFTQAANENNESVYLCYDNSYYYIFPQKSVDVVLNNQRNEIIGTEDITLNQDLSGIDMKSAIYSIDSILAQSSDS